MDIEHFCNAQLKYIMSVNVSYGKKNANNVIRELSNFGSA